jgi:hypothetical protein
MWMLKDVWYSALTLVNIRYMDYYLVMVFEDTHNRLRLEDCWFCVSFLDSDWDSREVDYK